MRSKCRLNTLFRFKDSSEKEISSGIIYRYTCSNCKVTYYWKTFRHFYTREAEHMGIFNLTGKNPKKNKQSTLSDHLLQCNCTINFDHFDFLASDFNKTEILVRESFDKMWQTDLKEDDKIVSIRVLPLKWQFHFYYHMIVRVFF